MATGAGLRYAIAGMPTPGSGLDDQDRYAIGGVVLPANSITFPAIGSTFKSKQRAALAGVIVPDNAINDEQDRFHLAGVIKPNDFNQNISAQQRAFIAGMRGWGGGAGFSENDRAHIAGIYPYNEESVFYEKFTITYTLKPTSTETLSPNTVEGQLDVVISSIISGLTATGPSLDVEYPIQHVLVDMYVRFVDARPSARTLVVAGAKYTVSVESAFRELVTAGSERSIVLYPDTRDL